jgi:hypothetical protein
VERELQNTDASDAISPRQRPGSTPKAIARESINPKFRFMIARAKVAH